MEKSSSRHTVSTLLLGSVFLITLQADAQWKCIGLESDTILSITLSNVVEHGVIAGTKSRGIKIYANSEWHDISTARLPVHDIFVTNSKTFIAAIGAGSNSDGVYSACAVYDGPPYYELNAMPFYGMMFPQAVTATEMGDKVYMGSGNVIVSGISANPASGNYETFHAMKIPPNAFGVEKPRCAALVIHNWGVSLTDL
jgi:hypothetical protein